MLTPRTQKAIALLYDLTLREENSAYSRYRGTPEEAEELLALLEKKGLITPIRKEEGGTEKEYNHYSYRPARPFDEISLLDILEALDEHLDCNRITTEEFYNRYYKVAQKLGVINYMTRSYLQEIKLTSL